MTVINRTLLAPKLHYFLVFATLAGSVPFLMTMATQMGASTATVGLIYSTLPFIVMVSKPLIGSLADKLQQKKTIFLVTIVVFPTSIFTLYFNMSIGDKLAPHLNVYNPTNVTMMCHAEGLSLHACNDDSQTHILAEDITDDWNVSEAVLHKPTATCIMTCTLINDTATLVTSMCNKMYTCVNYTSSTDQSLWVLTLFADVASARSHTNHCLDIPVSGFETGRGTSHEHSCHDNSVLARCHGSCHDVVKYHEGPVVEDSTSGHHRPAIGIDGAAFYINREIVFLWLCMVSAWIGSGAAMSICDSIVLDLLKDKSNFGRQRLWGSVGWGLCSVVTGQLVDMVSRGKQELDFTPCYFVTLVLGALDVAVVSQIRVDRVEQPRNIFRQVLHLFADLSVCVFALSVFLVGTLTGIQWTFLIVYLNELGASQLMVGLTLGVQCFLSEIPCFFASGWLLKKIGHAHAATLVLLIFGTRFVLYSLVSDPWMVLPIELMHGITFGLFYAALATYPSRIAPVNTQATIQGLFQGIFEGFGVGIGCFVGGVLYQSLGGKMMWFTAGISSAVMAVIVGLLQVMLSRRTAGRAVFATSNGQDAPKDEKKEEMIPMYSSETPIA